MRGARTPKRTDAGARLVRIGLLLTFVLILSVDLQALVLAIDAIGLDLLLTLIVIQVGLGGQGLMHAGSRGLRAMVGCLKSLPAAAVRLLGILMPAGGATLAARQMLFDCARVRGLAAKPLLMTALLVVIGMQA
jgi:hypothetical protein